MNARRRVASWLTIMLTVTTLPYALSRLKNPELPTVDS